jgi:hypothetical protein
MTNAARITDPKDALNFMLAGRARFTLRSEKTGTRFTFQVSQPEGKDIWFVGLLTSGDNESGYSYVGIISKDFVFLTTGASKLPMDAPPLKAFSWTLRHLVERQEVPPQLEVWHEGACGKCGRTLTVPESIASGFGPTCIESRHKFLCEA